MFTIAAVERETGLSKDVLRVWERRYGFPKPERDANGERVYPPTQLEQLRLLKRLMDQGHRPGKLMVKSLEELQAMVPAGGAAQADPAWVDPDPELDRLIACIRRHDAEAYARQMQQRLGRQGLMHFVLDILAPLTYRIGLAWESGQIEVFEEHLFTEQSKRLLRQAISALPGGRQAPKVILTSVPEEQHVLGLLMVEALLALEGASCVSLGTQMPLMDIARAARAHRADIVALSFSAAFASRQIPELLDQLRVHLPAGCQLWVGGGGVRRVVSQNGIQVIQDLASLAPAVAAWRDAQATAEIR